jgi:hypothetical protein
LALLLERKGRFPEATELLWEAAAINLRTKGADGPSYANELRNLEMHEECLGFPADFVKDDKGTVSHPLLPASGDDIKIRSVLIPSQPWLSARAKGMLVRFVSYGGREERGRSK